MPYLTKTDIKVTFDLCKDIFKWILRGGNPMEPFEWLEGEVWKDDELMNELTIDREKLRLGKYTRGFEKLTSDQLQGLLWLFGEWAVRSDWEDPMGRHPRSKAAFKAMLNFRYKPMTIDEVMALMRDSAINGSRESVMTERLNKLYDEEACRVHGGSLVIEKYRLEKEVNSLVIEKDKFKKEVNSLIIEKDKFKKEIGRLSSLLSSHPVAAQYGLEAARKEIDRLKSLAEINDKHYLKDVDRLKSLMAINDKHYMLVIKERNTAWQEIELMKVEQLELVK